MSEQPLQGLLKKISEKCARRRVSGEIVLRTVYKTCAEMLQDRGFVLKHTASTTDELLKTIDKVKPVMSADMDGHMAFVYFDKEERTGIKFVRGLLETHENDLLIIVSVEGPTPFCRKEVGNRFLFNCFVMKELTYNVSKHVLVPPHRLVSTREAEEIMQRDYSALPKQLPVLMMDDPIRRYYNFPLGSLVEIQRTGIAQEACLYFRRVGGQRNFDDASLP